MKNFRNFIFITLLFSFSSQSYLFCEGGKKRKTSEVFEEEPQKKKIKLIKKDLLKEQFEKFDYKLETKLRRSDLLRGSDFINDINSVKKLCSKTIEKIDRIDNLGITLKSALEKVKKHDDDSFADLKKALRAFFATIPYYGQIKIQDSITLQLVLYMVFKASGIGVSLGECQNSYDEDNKEQVLIVQRDGQNYFISAKFFKERSLDDDDSDVNQEEVEPKKTKVKRCEAEYKKIDNSDGISFQINLYGDDTEYQEAFLNRLEFAEKKDTPEQIDSRLKFDVEKDFSDVYIQKNNQSSCDTGLVKEFLSLLADGEQFRENEIEKTEEFKENCQEFFKKLPYEIEFEKGYHLVLYTIFKMNGFNSKIEQASSKGRSDLVVDAGGNIYIFEFKYSKTKYNVSKAMKQMITKRYNEIYSHERSRDNIFGIAVSFGPSGQTDIQVGKMPVEVTPYKKQILTD